MPCIFYELNLNVYDTKKPEAMLGFFCEVHAYSIDIEFKAMFKDDVSWPFTLSRNVK